jgi:CSLREA domain-containing protein
LVVVVLLGGVLAQSSSLAVQAAPLLSAIAVTTLIDEYNTSGVGNGCSLREAITAANTGAAFGGCPAGSNGADTINLAAGIYTLTIINASGVNEDNNVTGDLDVNQSLTIQGAGAGNTIIQAGIDSTSGIDKVLALNPTCAAGVNVTLDGVTIRYGRNTQVPPRTDYSFPGGGLDWCGGGANETFNFSHAEVIDNTNVNGYGGGLNLDSVSGTYTVNISQVTFRNNKTSSTTQTANGGAINIVGGMPTVNINNCTFDNNSVAGSSFSGGAIYYRPTTLGHLTIDGSTFTNNISAGTGGAISVLTYGTNSTFILRNSQLSNNSSTGSTGGGLYLHGSDVNVTPFDLSNLLISGNTASQQGGGIYVNGVNVVLSKSRIVNNTGSEGSGLYKSSITTTATVSNNWWGCSTGPGASPCNQVAVASGGTLVSSPWWRNNLTSSPSTLVTNQSSALTASFLSNSAGGAVVASDLGQLIGQTVLWNATGGTFSSTQATLQTSGTATGTFTASAAGTANIYARVDQDKTSGTSSNILNLTVNKANTTTTITNAASLTGTSSAKNEAVTVNYSVTGAYGNSPTAPTGNVTVSDGTASCTGTVAAGSCAITFSTGGNKTITATYTTGDANFNASPASSGVTHTVVVKDDTTTTITNSTSLSSTTSVTGQSVTVNYSVSGVHGNTPSPTGNVTVSDGTESCTASVAAGSCALVFHSVGSKVLTATYTSGDANYNASPASSGAAHTVNPANTTSSLTTSASPTINGAPVTLTATVTVSLPGAGLPTGTVTFKEGAATLGTANLNGSGQASFTTTTLVPGSHSITAEYGGNGNFAGSVSDVLVQVVNQNNNSIVLLTSAPNPSVLTQLVTFTAVVSGGGTGTITFKEGAVVLGSGPLDGEGKATFSTQALTPGSHSITAEYAGDTNHLSGVSSPLTQTVNLIETTLTLSSNKNPSEFGQLLTLTANVVSGYGTPIGTVIFKEGENVLGTSPLDGAGQAVLNTRALGAGRHMIKAEYSGASNQYLASVSEILEQWVNGPLFFPLFVK